MSCSSGLLIIYTSFWCSNKNVTVTGKVEILLNSDSFVAGFVAVACVVILFFSSFQSIIVVLYKGHIYIFIMRFDLPHVRQIAK